MHKTMIGEVLLVYDKDPCTVSQSVHTEQNKLKIKIKLAYHFLGCHMYSILNYKVVTLVCLYGTAHD